MTPYELKILIHIITCGDDFHCTDSELRKSTLTHFENVKAIEKCNEGLSNGHGYSATDLGRAWLISILRTEIPTIGYINEQGKLIEF